MKKWVRRMSRTRNLALVSRRGVMDRANLWRDFCPRCRVRNALDDYLIVLREAGPDHPQAAAKIADLDPLGHDGAVRRDSHDDVLRLVGEYGRVRHEESRHRSADDQPDPGEQARSEQTVGIRDGGSGVDRTARPVERIVYEIKSALPSELCFVAERDLNLVGKASFEPRTTAGKGQEIGLAHIKVQIDRIERDERREQCRWAGRGTAAGDQVADGDEMRADATGEGCRDTAMLEIELGVTNLSLRIVHGGLPGSLVGRALIDGLFRSEGFSR